MNHQHVTQVEKIGLGSVSVLQQQQQQQNKTNCRFYDAGSRAR